MSIYMYFNLSFFCLKFIKLQYLMHSDYDKIECHFALKRPIWKKSEAHSVGPYSSNINFDNNHDNDAI